MSKKITIARNMSDPKSREWWDAIDELARNAPKLELQRKPFGQTAPPTPREKPSSSKSSRSRK